eukprot:TRINITY_DN35546_c0_g1_i1.p1 TRINITY_DN35546_c0_g1~~TRINITY_DN35546_c0_g1_i1.p1  ORF type:complete len:776 (-),score=126.41 TRINITY_DN35546_c0_g1_i1:307-2634(-)
MQSWIGSFFGQCGSSTRASTTKEISTDDQEGIAMCVDDVNYKSGERSAQLSVSAEQVEKILQVKLTAKLNRKRSFAPRADLGETRLLDDATIAALKQQGEENHVTADPDCEINVSRPFEEATPTHADSDCSPYSMEDRQRGIYIEPYYDFFNPMKGEVEPMLMSTAAIHQRGWGMPRPAVDRVPTDFPDDDSCLSWESAGSEAGLPDAEDGISEYRSPPASPPASRRGSKQSVASVNSIELGDNEKELGRRRAVVMTWAVIVTKYMKTAADSPPPRRTCTLPTLTELMLKSQSEKMAIKEGLGKNLFSMGTAQETSMECIERAMSLAARIAATKKDMFDWEWHDAGLLSFIFGTNYVEALLLLANSARRLIMSQSIVATCDAPCKIFGDIHGQFRDLLFYLHVFGNPNNSDQNFVFNGDFVDRGSHQIEVIGLLLALKIAYPSRVFLIRGNHEERQMNRKYGFEDSCEEHLGQKMGPKFFNTVQVCFDHLPLACVVGGRMLVVHGGLGDGKWMVNDLRRLKRPLLTKEEDVHSKGNNWWVNILWSDPIEEDDINMSTAADVFGVHKSVRMGNIVRFGLDVTKTFCARNGLNFVLRSHQCVEGGQGFDIMHDGMLLRLFSARDYESMANDGSIVQVDNVPGENILSIRAQVLSSWAKTKAELVKMQTPRRNSRPEAGMAKSVALRAPGGRRKSLGDLSAEERKSPLVQASLDFQKPTSPSVARQSSITARSRRPSLSSQSGAAPKRRPSKERPTPKANSSLAVSQSETPRRRRSVN